MERLPASSGSQSVERALDLLAMVAEAHRTGVLMSELVTTSGLTRPTTHRLMATLVRAGLVEHDESDNCYYLGANSFSLGVIAADRFGLQSLAVASVDRLAEVSADTAFFSIRRGAASVCLLRQEGRFPIRSHVLNVGQRRPLGVAAHGIAILAALDDAEIESVLKENAEIYTEQYPRLTPDFLWQLVGETRERGWSLNQGLFFENAWAMGTVVYDSNGEIAGALSIGAMKDRLGESRQAEFAVLLKQEAERMRADHQRYQKLRGGLAAKPQVPSEATKTRQDTAARSERRTKK